ncbi:MAG TPA: MFS transporter [Ktedonobacterales bacterium]|nr:MFS transporter [Ktedonobacterales bacterium]
MSRAWFINRQFVSLWLGQSVSQLGDAVLEVTLPIWVGLLTNNPAQVAGVALAETLPALCLGPLAGVAADRWNPRKTMLACDLLRGLLVGGLLFVPASALPGAIYVVSFCVALLSNLFNPAKSVAIRFLVKEEEMMRAQALARTTQSGALILGPMLGAALLFWFGPVSGLLLDALSFGLSAAALLLVPSFPRLPRAAARSLWEAWRAIWQEAWAGIGFAARHRPLVTLLVANSVLSLVGSLWYAVDVFFVRQSLGAPKASVGLLWAASGIGGLLGGALALLAAPERQERLFLCGLFLRGSSLLCYALLSSYVAALPAAVFAGLGEALASIALGSMVIERTAHTFLGRVTALFDMASQLTTLIALLAVGALSAWLSPWQILLLCGFAIILVSFGSLLRLKPALHPAP